MVQLTPCAASFIFFLKILNYVCFNDFFVSLHTLHPFLGSVFSFRCKHGAFTVGGSTGRTLWFNRPRNWGLMNRAVRVKLRPSYSDNKSDIPCFKIYIYALQQCLYAKAELIPSRKQAVILKKQKIGSSDPVLHTDLFRDSNRF